MTGRRNIAGLCMLCALVFCAIAAQSAMAVTGTKAFTCAPGGSGFSDAHCKVGGGSGFSHVSIALETVTEASGSNITTGEARSTVALESKQAGIAEQIVSKKVEASGSMVNKETGGGEHYVEGSGVIEFLEVEVTKPAGKGCKVKGGQVVTNELAATTKEQGDFVKFSPASGAVLAEFEIEGCSVTALNGVYKVEGSLKAKAEGGTAITTHAEVTAQATLKVRGQTAGLESSSTISGRANQEDSFKALAPTTVEGQPASKGTTVVTCKSGSANWRTVGFTGPHCVTRGEGVIALYQHYGVAANTQTEVRGTNGGTAGGGGPTEAVLQATVEAIPLKLTAAEVELTGAVTNQVDTGGEHYLEGTGGILFKKVKVIEPGPKLCSVHTDTGGVEGAIGEIHTEPLKLTTTGQGDWVKIEPQSGTVLATFFLECEAAAGAKAIEGTLSVFGSIRGKPDGATLEFDHATTTTANTLSIQGGKAGFSGSITMEGRDVNVEWRSLAATTFETP